MLIKVTTEFFDRENDCVLRAVGTELEVPDKRGLELVEYGFAEEVEQLEPQTTAEEAEPEKPKRTRTKKNA